MQNNDAVGLSSEERPVILPGPDGGKYMIYDFSQIPDAYELIHSEYIPEVRSMAGLLRHKKTGARLALLSNDDDNKVFNIGFRTPPADSTGVAHIMEHSVLCGSEKYPAKDPFVELCKGSLNTFLNAMTYPDKTIYPLASYNDKDFVNLMDVYLDAVFHPNIYLTDKTFRQEGWHYELADEESPVFVNGVVYNEMKGAFSSPDEVLNRKISETLYPDITYGVESGGDPDYIPDLTYERYLDFHRRYYHPSNSYIYLYGDMDMTERLEYLDREYLGRYDYLEIDSHIDLQPAFETPALCRAEYPAEEEAGDNAAYMAVSWVLPAGQDAKLSLAFQILEYALMEASGAPLKKALLDRELGEDIYGSLETSLQQPYLSIVIKNMDERRRDEITAVIRETLEQLVRDGLNRRTLEGALGYYEFKSRESDFGRWPKGLMYGLQMMDSWLYDDDAAFTLLKYQQAYGQLKEDLDRGYFEDLIRTWLLKNTHQSVLLLCPSGGLAAAREQARTEKMAALKASLDPVALRQMIADTADLKAYQTEPTPKEVLEQIPLLEISDIRRSAAPLYNKEIRAEEVPVLIHDIPTNGIDYVNLIFDIGHIPEEDIPYLGILSEVIGSMDTAAYSYSELNDEVNLSTGGITTAIMIYGREQKDAYRPVLEVHARALHEKLDSMLALTWEMLAATSLADTRRLKEVLMQQKSRMEMNFMSAGHSTAVSRAMSYISQGTWFKENTDGIAFYQFLSDLLKDYDSRCGQLTEKLTALARKIFRRDRLMVSWTAEEAQIMEGLPKVLAMTGRLFAPSGEEEPRVYVGTCPYRNEAFTTQGTVQYNACVTNIAEQGIPYHGSIQVLKNVLANDYLWNNVRVKGGAYGCMCAFAVSGKSYLTSYRDPKLSETYEIYNGAADYVRSLTLDERELTKYIIGAIGAVDIPMTPLMNGARSEGAYLTGRTYEMIQKSRDELLDTTVEDLRALAPAVAALAAGHRCCVGSESSIRGEEAMFEQVSPLLR